MVKANHMVGCSVPPSGGTSFLVGTGVGLVWNSVVTWIVAVVGGIDGGAGAFLRSWFGCCGHLGCVWVAICLACVDFDFWCVGRVAALARR